MTNLKDTRKWYSALKHKQQKLPARFSKMCTSYSHTLTRRNMLFHSRPETVFFIASSKTLRTVNIKATWQVASFHGALKQWISTLKRQFHRNLNSGIMQEFEYPIQSELICILIETGRRMATTEACVSPTSFRDDNHQEQNELEESSSKKENHKQKSSLQSHCRTIFFFRRELPRKKKSVPRKCLELTLFFPPKFYFIIISWLQEGIGSL